MAQVYSATTITNSTFTATNRTTLVDGIKTILVSSGWTVVSGSSGGWILRSLATPDGLQMRVGLTDPGSGNCATVKAYNAGGTINSGTAIAYLFPNTDTWRVIADGYQFFAMHDGSETADSRDFVFCGVPALPDFLSGVVTECVVLSSNAISDSLSGSYGSFRNCLIHIPRTSNAKYWVLLNGTALGNASGDTGPGVLSFRIGTQPFFANSNANLSTCQVFYDLSNLIDTPYICFNPSSVLSNSTINGIVWDAVLLEQNYAYGTTRTMDSKSWFCVTSNNPGVPSGTGAGIARGSLFVRIT